jgi:hypothetical protein
VRLASQRLRANRDACRAGRMSRARFRESLVAWIAHASHGDTYQLRKAMLRKVIL